MNFTSKLNKLKQVIRNWAEYHGSRQAEQSESIKLMLGRLLTAGITGIDAPKNLHELEFKVFSQCGDDGIIQWLVNKVNFPSKTFIEFGVEDYTEANTRFLLMNNNWSGLIIDGSATNIEQVKSRDYYWRHQLTAISAFVDRDNINGLISNAGLKGEVGILHIDIDGNDYWIWESISVVDPVLVIVEYNSVFGGERSISVPYDAGFVRNEKHYSNLYFGASLKAFTWLAKKKGYTLLGSNSAGNNAYFLRDDHMREGIPSVTPEDGYVCSRFRESRNPDGALTFLAGEERLRLIAGLPVCNVETGQLEEI